MKRAVFAIGCLVVAAALAFGLTGCAETQPAGRTVPLAEDTIEHGKKALVEPSEDSDAPQEDPNAFITVAGVDPDGVNASVSGYASGLARSGLQCVFEFVQGDDRVIRETTSVENRSVTSCGLVQVPIEELGRGSWEVHLTVRLETGEVTGDAVVMEVP
jgi:hypothetical protein